MACYSDKLLDLFDATFCYNAMKYYEIQEISRPWDKTNVFLTQTWEEWGVPYMIAPEKIAFEKVRKVNKYPPVAAIE